MAMAIQYSLLPIVLFAFVSVCSSERPLPPFHHNGKPLPGAHPPTLPPPLHSPQPQYPSPFIPKPPPLHKPPFVIMPPMKEAHPPTLPKPESPHASPLIPKRPPFHKPPPFSPANAPHYHNPGSPISNAHGQPHLPLNKSPPKPKHGQYGPPPMHKSPPPHPTH